ncbi:MAG: hypothetical protein HQL42_11740 [Alphaproteobacteria bacterium]|nr:hypothetical protein [Alphaproteobacteria bacterium]
MSHDAKLRGPMSAALEPLAQRMRGQSPLIRSVSRVAFMIEGDNAFDKTVRQVVKWMKNRSANIPAGAFDGLPFEVGGGGDHPAEAVRFDEDGGRLWAAILDDSDKEVARRTWVTEITVGERNGRTAFGARLINISRGEDVPFTPSRPGVVHGVISDLEAVADGVPLLDKVVAIENEDDFEQFWELLTNPNRTLPVIVTAIAPGIEPVVDLNILPKLVSGLAHMVTLTQEMSWELTRRVGRKISVYDGATRIYQPGFDPDDADPFQHGLWLSRPTDDGEARGRRLAQIITWTLTNSVRSKRIPEFPRYAEFRRWSDERRSKAAKSLGQSDPELISLYEAEIKQLNEVMDAKMAEYDDLLSAAEADLSRVERQEKEARDANRLLRQRLEALENAMRESDRDFPDAPLTKYEDIDAWAEKQLVGSIWISSKALRTASKAQFSDIDLFGKTLLMLRDFYVPMRRIPSPAHRKAYEGELAKLGLEDSGCFSNPNDIHNFPAYRVTYGESTFWCGNHIKFGNGYDPRAMFRIYYYWHAEDGMLLIGHMPTHLDNMRTN